MATERVPGARSVATGVWVGVGARDEPADLRASATSSSTCCSRARRAQRRSEISRADRPRRRRHQRVHVEGVHVVLLPPAGAITWRSGSSCSATCSSRPALRDDDVETERQVILEELAMDDDSPDDVAHRDLADALFPDHPLGRDTAGERDTVAAITADDVRVLRPSSTAPEHGGRRSPGPTTTTSARRGAASAFAGVAARRRASPTRRRPGADRRIDRVRVDDTEQVAPHRRWPRACPATTTGARRSTSSTTSSVAALSSRLFEEIRERRGLAYSVYSGVERIRRRRRAHDLRRHAARSTLARCAT